MPLASDGVCALRADPFAAGHGTEIIVTQITQNGAATHQRNGIFVLQEEREVLVGFLQLMLHPATHLTSALQVPVFHMSITDSDKVAAIFGKTNGGHLRTYFVGGHFQIRSPIEHIDNHVVLRAHRYQVLARGRECLEERELGVNNRVHSFFSVYSPHMLRHICDRQTLQRHCRRCTAPDCHLAIRAPKL